MCRIREFTAWRFYRAGLGSGRDQQSLIQHATTIFSQPKAQFLANPYPPASLQSAASRKTDRQGCSICGVPQNGRRSGPSRGRSPFSRWRIAIRAGSPLSSTLISFALAANKYPQIGQLTAADGSHGRALDAEINGSRPEKLLPHWELINNTSPQ